MPLLVVFGGLPGTGKTTLSRELARRLAAVYLRVDTIEQSLKAAGLAVGATGYALANALAAQWARCNIIRARGTPAGSPRTHRDYADTRRSYPAAARAPHKRFEAD